jgi:hypothetical protein
LAEGWDYVNVVKIFTNSGSKVGRDHRVMNRYYNSSINVREGPRVRPINPLLLNLQDQYLTLWSPAYVSSPEDFMVVKIFFVHSTFSPSSFKKSKKIALPGRITSSGVI